MFYDTQNLDYQKNYIDGLTIIGNLSNLFSDSATPYLYYRIAEKIFCNSFNANDLSRGDIALDASKSSLGIGLKTFLKKNDKTIQKIAEFNKDLSYYEGKENREIVDIVSKRRNERIRFAEKLSGVEKSLYHCVVRDKNVFYLHEEEMSYIEVENITNIVKKKNSIHFDDGVHEYSFNISKSTLFKRFNITNYLHNFEVKIFDNPLIEIQKCFLEHQQTLQYSTGKIIDTVFLPLWGKDKIVSPRSGLNQWNASGRQRHFDEIYIPIPSKVHKNSPSFFPPRDTSFSLHLPNGNRLDVKVCQDNNKALMSNPNKDLGKWLLRDVLELAEGELLTYEKLQNIGIGSVRLDKIDDANFKINFVELADYENSVAIDED